MPAAVEIHAELARFGRPCRRGRWCDGEAFADLVQKLLGRAAVEVAHDAVVVENGHGVVREDDAEEIAMGAFRPAAAARG